MKNQNLFYAATLLIVASLASGCASTPRSPQETKSGRPIGNQYTNLVSIPQSCSFLQNEGLIVARSNLYDIVYAYDGSVAMECCLSKLPIGYSSSEYIARKACIHHGETGWSVNLSPNHYMDPMRIYLPGHKRELDAYYFALGLVTK